MVPISVDVCVPVSNTSGWKAGKPGGYKGLVGFFELIGFIELVELVELIEKPAWRPGGCKALVG